MIIVLFLYHVQRYDSYFLKISTGKCKQYRSSYTPYTPSDIPQTSDHSCITRYFCGFIHQTILLWSSDHTTWQVHTAWFRSSQEPSISYAIFTCITTFLNHALHSSEASQKNSSRDFTVAWILFCSLLLSFVLARLFRNTMNVLWKYRCVTDLESYRKLQSNSSEYIPALDNWKNPLQMIQRINQSELFQFFWDLLEYSLTIQFVFT